MPKVKQFQGLYSTITDVSVCIYSYNYNALVHLNRVYACLYFDHVEKKIAKGHSINKLNFKQIYV